MSDNIKVVVKVRPLIARELNQKIGCQWRVNNNTLLQIDNHGKDVGSSFTFDKVYDKDSKTQDLYNDVAKPIVEAAVAGFNGTIFAYGQTSSGKTYTMTGTEESPGIIPLAVLNLYDIIKTIPNRDFLVRVSYIEIYNETLNDLLNVENKNIKIRDTLQSGVKLYTTEKVTSTPEEVLEIMKEGEANRQTGATNMNEESSRSHSIFQITIESREHVEGEEESGCVNVSQLNLVDLAGSERAGQTGATGTRFKEGTHINKSLSVLALVIKQLSDDPNKHANYRDSKLTRILQNSLGGNAKTSIVCAVTPTSVEETISTLQFANRAKAVKNKPEVNAVATNATMIQSLTKELSKLQSELVGKKNLEQDNVNLQRKIAQLQKLILNGFGQRSRIDMLDTTRRKLQLPRRVTISTLHHSIEEDPLPPMPKFCTPSLKYNPLAHSSEFLPVQNSSKLASLPEEPRLVTPPPKDKKVNFGDEIIDLDSDDDAVSDIQACSPYHECFASTKTPPCILRKNAKQAEKNLKDLVELTDREKIYTPSVVELMEKLEQNSNIISRLEDEVDTLTKESKEKDSQMEILKDKILKAEEDIKSITIAKLDLEALCKDCNTKLTDWEVSYENLKKKAKSREDELLSLLEEQRVARKPVETDKPQPRTVEQELLNFMDMSKDISLVNSDNENSAANDEDSQIQDLVAGIQAQLIAKTQVIVELEADIINQRQKIISLENSSQQLHGIVNSVNDKLSCLDTENSFLKSTIETLNSTIENQKLNLETANNDIKSYNSLIQELQIKLTKKDSILNVKINDTLIENMIANEEKFIANNENIKNIIHSLKLTIDSRNKEIDNLKSNALVNSHLITDNMTLKEQINDKEKQIYILIKEIDNLKDNLNDNVTVISELLKVEKEITHNLNVVQEENNSLKGSIAENNKYIENLNQNKEILSLTITESKLREQIISDKNLALTKQIQDTLLKITSLEKYIIEKDDLIAYFLEVDKGKQEYLVKAKSTLGTLQSILITLDCNNFELPHLVADYDTFFNKLHEGLNFLKITSTAAVEQTKITVNKSALLQQECSAIEKKLQSELALLKSQLDILNIERNDIIQKNKNVSQQVIELTNDLDKIRNELNTKCYDTIDIETKLNDAKESNQNLRNDLLCKDNIISSLQEKISSLLAEVQLLSQDKELHNMLNKEVENLKSKVLGNEDLYNQSLCKKDKEISEILDSGKVNIETLLEEKRAELLVLTQKLNDALESRDQLLEIILNRASEIISDFNIDNNTFCDLESDISTHEYIMLALQQIAKHMTLINSHNCNEHGNVKETLSEAKTQINELTQQNLKLLNDFSEIDNKNQVLLDEIDKIKSINVNLSGTSDLLEQLKIELNVKAREIDVMELKARELRDQFAEFECIMKQQKDSLQQENEKLKQQMMASEKKTISDGIVLDSDNNECHIPKTLSTSIKKNEIKSPQSLLTISYNKLRETLQLNETDYSSLTTSSSKSFIEVHNAETQAGMCECIQLSLQLKIVNEENLKLVASLMQLENINRTLIKEREEVRKEVKLLLEPADELQKRLSNHRTNLSTFTATTYAENKLLNSQLKVLKHHHTRYIHVCQRDIPAFKSQLHELMVILKGHTSLTDKQNASFKRYSLPDILDDNTTLTNLKNESTLDGDLLMLDSNVTSADNTLTGHDQTCLDITQINFDNEVACQTNDKEFDPFLIYSQIELLTNDNKNINEELETLAEENEKLRQQFAKCANNPSSTIHKVDAHGNPVKINMSLNQNQLENRLSDGNFCKNCEHIQSLKDENVKLLDVLKMVSQELSQVKTQREAMETKYTNLMPAKDALVKKLNIIEKEYNNKLQEITNDLITKNALVKELQEENITLSTQVMDNISEVDDLKKELDSLKELNTKLCGQITEESIGNATNIAANCPQSLLKDDLNLKFEIRSNLNRSLSDSASSSRYNTICTLQNELHASKKDCQKITDEVATIKNQLERSNLSITQSMDLDGSVDDVNLFACNKDFDSEIRLNQYDLPHIPEEVDDYRLDQMECLNYYMERTGAEKENLTSTKIIDVMKMFYNFLTTKHGNEVENLLNKLRDFEESKNVLVLQFKNVTTEYSKVNQELNERRNNLENVTNILSHIRNNSDFVIQEFSNVDVDNANKTKLFKETILRVLDSQFGLSTVEVFEVLIDIIGDEHHKDLNDHMERYAQLQEQMESILVEFSNVSDNLSQIKSELSGKEKEYNILKTEKEKVYEICNAVTLDIIKKENDLKEIIAHACKKILELNIMSPENIDLKLPVKETLELLFEHVINQFKNLHQSVIEKENMIVEVQKSQTALERKDVELQLLKSKFVDKEAKLEENIALYKDLKEIYDNKVKENNVNMHIVNNLTEDLKVLKEEVAAKETVIQTLENEITTKQSNIKVKEDYLIELTHKIEDLVQENENLSSAVKNLETDMNSVQQNATTKGGDQLMELIQRISDLTNENETLKSLNQMIESEKESCAKDLAKTREIIDKNKLETEKLTSDIHVLNDAIKDNISKIETLKLDVKSLMQQNLQLKEQFESKCQACSRLEMNIKTHEKTAEIQSRMIMRLQKQKDEDDKIMNNKDTQLEELTQKCLTLQVECDEVKVYMKKSKGEIGQLKDVKESLETRISEMEIEMGKQKNRLSSDALSENSRRRRRSIHDSKRMFGEDHNNMEAVFESCTKSDDLFMDVDEHSSSRSTPTRLSRGRDSFQSRPDQNEKDEETPSRPSSVLATRRRRQSTHDLHRSVVEPTPNGLGDASADNPSVKITDVSADIVSADTSGGNDSEVSQLRERLANCQQELEELKDKYRELDDECETCAQYLQERDEQCSRLKKEKSALENQVTELNEKLKTNQDRSNTESKTSFVHASVNTDEDWTKLHSVVVDRMSFDAEVEKNKKLTKTIEELRYKKQELKYTLAKMEKTLENYNNNRDKRELDTVKGELKACKQELVALRQRYKELDEECETCAEYLRERDEQCRKLKEAKTALEVKLQQFQDERAVAQSVRKKRQSLHDQNRAPSPDLIDASTETSDFLSYQVERDDKPQKANENAHAREIKHLKKALDKVSKEKVALEHLAASAQMANAMNPILPAMYVATGSAIVQNQQLTDVMKENQKLKKVNSKLIQICKKRGKTMHESNRENEEHTEQG